MVMTESGIELLGGHPNGLNFEIEYIDSEQCYREAVYSVHLDYTLKTVAIVLTSLHDTILWIEKDGYFQPLFIHFPRGVREFIDFRCPTAVGGDSIIHQFIGEV